MAVFTEGLNLGDVLKHEAPNLYSRDRAMVAPRQTLVLGQVVGRITVSGQVAALDPAANDGRQTAFGVLLAPMTTADTPNDEGLVLARHGVVADHALTWPATITPEQRAAAVAQLRVLGVLVRRGV